MTVLRIPNKEDRHWSYRYRCEKCGQEHVSSCELPEHMADHPPLDVDPDRVLAWMDGAEDAELDAMAAQETDAK